LRFFIKVETFVFLHQRNNIVTKGNKNTLLTATGGIWIGTMRVSVAPMLQYTDRHMRYLLRMLSPSTVLYTEMVSTGSILHNRLGHRRMLAFSPEEQPVVLQLGGCDPSSLAACTSIAHHEYNYTEVNLNVGCPSDKASAGRFGACLMAEPHLVASCVAAMKRAAPVRVTVKSRIGIDDCETYEFFRDFVQTVHAESECSHFVVHARKAYLKGLSPAENRTVPPLKYAFVHRLKQEMPHLTIELNGGVTTVAEVRNHAESLDGVMIGRHVMANPVWLQDVEREVFQTPPSQLKSIREAVDAYMDYMERMHVAEQVPWRSMARHMLNLCAGLPGARTFRRELTEGMIKKDRFGRNDVETCLSFIM
jgi:tRNA-dihydrouridine synthase A